MQLHIAKVSKKPINTKWGMKNKLGILTQEYGDQWLNGWESQITANLQAGDTIEAEVSDSQYGLEFKATQLYSRPAPMPAKPAPVYIPEPKKEEPNWDKISWGKCKTLFLVEAYKKGESLNKAELEAELWADACMRNLSETSPNDSQNEIYIENIPFN